MSTNPAIRGQDKWFLSSKFTKDGKIEDIGYPLSYRLVICRALLHYLEKFPNRPTNVPALIQRVIDQFNDKKPTKDSSENHHIADSFMEVFQLKDGNGFVVVDQTDGCFPLMLYSEEARLNRDGYERVTSFVEALEAVRDNWERVRSKLQGKRVDEWDRDIQQTVLEVIPEPNSRRRAA